MIRHLHRVTTKSSHQHHRQHDSAAPYQHDSTSISRCGQVTSEASSSAWLYSIVASMSQHLYRATTKSSQQCHYQHDSISLSSAWFDIYIASWPIRPDSAVASMTQHLHHATTKSLRQRHHQQDSTAPSPAWLDNAIINMNRYLHHIVIKAPQQHHSQEDSTAPLSTWLDINVMQRLDHQQQYYMTLAASRLAASSYRYYSPLCLVSGPMQACQCAAWHLCEAFTFWKLAFEDFKL
jgi:hypothetical protein